MLYHKIKYFKVIIIYKLKFYFIFIVLKIHYGYEESKITQQIKLKKFNYIHPIIGYLE